MHVKRQSTWIPGRWNTVLPSLGFLTSKQAGMLGQKSLILGREIVRMSKSGIWFCVHIFTSSEPTFFLLYAGRKVQTESIKWSVPEEASCCFSSESIPLLLAGFQTRAGGALGVAAELSTEPAACAVGFGNVDTQVAFTHSVCWSLQQAWKYYCGHWQLPWKVNGTFKALWDCQEKICLTSKKVSLSPNCSCLTRENVAWCITSAFHYW